MAWFNPQKNRGHKGGIELGFGGIYGITTKVERYKSTEEYMGYGSYPGPGLHAGYGPERKEHGPWTSASLDRTKKGDMFGSTNYAHRDNSPPPRGKFHKNNNKNYYSSDDEDDVECDDEQCYPKPNGHVDHNIPYHETNSYPNDGYNNRPTYTVPVTTQPRKDHGNNRPTYTVPATTQPRKDPYYEPANSNGTVVHKPLPPVKTISDHHTKVKGVDSPVSGGSPFASSPGSPFTPSPRKEHGYGSREGVDSPGGHTRNKGASPRGGVWAEEIEYKEAIDSKKAAEKYGGTRNKGASPRGGVVAEEIRYKGTIDSKQAAKKYGGVFVDY